MAESASDLEKLNSALEGEISTNNARIEELRKTIADAEAEIAQLEGKDAKIWKAIGENRVQIREIQAEAVLPREQLVKFVSSIPGVKEVTEISRMGGTDAFPALVCSLETVSDNVLEVSVMFNTDMKSLQISQLGSLKYEGGELVGGYEHGRSEFLHVAGSISQTLGMDAQDSNNRKTYRWMDVDVEKMR